jgi:hypothetical protein
VLRRLSRNRLWLLFPIDFVIFFSRFFFPQIFFRQIFRKIPLRILIFHQYKISITIFSEKYFLFFWPKIDQDYYFPSISFFRPNIKNRGGVDLRHLPVATPRFTSAVAVAREVTTWGVDLPRVARVAVGEWIYRESRQASRGRRVDLPRVAPGESR